MNDDEYEDVSLNHILGMWRDYKAQYEWDKSIGYYVDEIKYKRLEKIVVDIEKLFNDAKSMAAEMIRNNIRIDELETLCEELIK